jgi:choline dehydrogenase-like flavoprotein
VIRRQHDRVRRRPRGPAQQRREHPHTPPWRCPRFQEHEFQARTVYGEIPGATLLDWPITLANLEPYYDRAETNMGVAGTSGMPLHEPNNNAKVLFEGVRRVGYKSYSTGHYGHNSVPYDGRPATIQDGFCFEGNRSRAKWSPLVADLPKGEQTGHLEVRPEAMVLRIEHDDSGRVTGVVYADADGNHQRQRARLVCVAGNAVETPRLLFNSASNLHPDGLANSSGQVGRNYMRHMSDTCWGVFDEPVHFYRGNTMAGIVEDEAYHDPDRGFVGGFSMETIHLGPAFMASFMNPHSWGRKFTTLMDAYENFAGMWLVGEDMPSATNRITLKPRRHRPVRTPRAERALRRPQERPRHARPRRRQGPGALPLARRAHHGAHAPFPASHNMGTTRMSERPDDGVVDGFGKAHDVPNLFVSDGSVFTTGAAANPTLTIIALAIRQADRIAEQMARQAL